MYFVLEAADWGLCLAAPLVSRNREENQAILSLLRPFLDGNELWFFMGFFMLSISLPDIRGTGMHAWYMTMLALVAGGALLRMAAVFLTKTFSSMVMMKGLSVFALVALFLTGLLGTAVLIDDGSVFTMSGIFCAAWTVLACFQIGSLYGAVKVVNPLGERFRAAFLVSSCLSVLAYIIFAVTLRITLGDAWDAGGYFWMSLIATALLFAAAFILTRSRHPEADWPRPTRRLSLPSPFISPPMCWSSRKFTLWIWRRSRPAWMLYRGRCSSWRRRYGASAFLYGGCSVKKWSTSGRIISEEALWENYSRTPIPSMTCLTGWV